MDVAIRYSPYKERWPCTHDRRSARPRDVAGVAWQVGLGEAVSVGGVERSGGWWESVGDGGSRVVMGLAIDAAYVSGELFQRRRSWVWCTRRSQERRSG